MPLPWQAPASKPTSGKAVMSWQVLVLRQTAPTACPTGACAPGSVFCRPLKAPVAGSVKIRGWLTIEAVSGAASGTWMMSILHCVGLPVVTGAWVSAAFLQPASQRRADPSGARVVDIDVVRVIGVGDQRVRVRPPAGLDAGQLHWVVEVADVEDADPPEALQVRPPWPCVPQSMRPRVSSTDMKSEVPEHRGVALAAGADERGAQHRVGRVGDVVDLEAVEAADDGVLADQRQVGVDEAEVAGRSVEGRHPRIVVEQLDVAAGF